MQNINRILTVVLLITGLEVRSQNQIEWNSTYTLQLSDFQSKQTQIGNSDIYSLHTASGIDFSFAMSNAEFMFTKNFNSKVGCKFNRSAASIVAPDSTVANDLLGFARYEFDLAELYARNLRKQLFEKKGTFSNVTFFQPLYDEIQSQLTERHTRAAKETDLGRNKEKLNALHQEVLKEIEALADFCKTCKPPKKKK